MARVNCYDSHASELRFVGEERTELPERTIMMLGSLAFANSCPRTNVFKVLNRYRSIRVLSFRDEPFGDAVVYVGLITALLAAHLSQVAFGGMSADLLQSGAALDVPKAFDLYLLAAVALTVAVRGKTSDAEVHAQNIVNITRRRLWHFAHSQQVELPLAIHKVSLTEPGFKQPLLTLAAGVRKLLPACNRPDGYELFVRVPRKNPIVKGYRAVGLKYTLRLFVELVSVRHLSYASHDDLS